MIVSLHFIMNARSNVSFTDVRDGKAYKTVQISENDSETNIIKKEDSLLMYYWDKHPEYRDILLREGDLQKYMEDVYTNEVLQFERLSSYFFHQLINLHRQKNGLSTLYWDDRLWLAARNHNIYMSNNKKLTHSQITGRDFFSGRSFSDRVKFVTYNLDDVDSQGENALYIYFSNNDNVVEDALLTAKEAMKIWMNSRGHNQNMLDMMHFSHGTAFYISNSRVYGTTVFGGKNSFSEYEITIHWDDTLALQYPVSYETVQVETKTSGFNINTERRRLKALISEKMPDKKKYDKWMFKAAQMHVIYLKTCRNCLYIHDKNSQNYYAETTTKRYLKASGYLGLFSILFNKINEKCFVFTFTEEEMKNRTAFKKIDDELSEALPHKDKIKKWGSHSELFRDKENYIYVIDVVYVKMK